MKHIPSPWAHHRSSKQIMVRQESALMNIVLERYYFGYATPSVSKHVDVFDVFVIFNKMREMGSGNVLHNIPKITCSIYRNIILL